MLSVDSSVNFESPHQQNAHPFPSSSSLRLGMSVNDLDLSFRSESERSQDSVAKKRRHGVYFHRPPVWCPGPCPHNNLPAIMRGCSFPCVLIKDDICDDLYCRPGVQRRQKFLFCPSHSRHVRTYPDRHEASEGEDELGPWGADMFCEMTAAALNARVDKEAGVSDTGSDDPLLASSLNSHLTVSNRISRHRPLMVPSALASEAIDSSDYQSSLGETSSSPSFRHSYFRQTKPGLCTRLQLYKDVRLGVGEKWAIQEGSLVVCVDPSYTRFDRREGFSDEFELVNGDFYIVCRLYADLWALCAKVSFNFHAGNSTHDTASGSMSLGFLPLCAVTLAANLSAFVRRCFKHTRFPTSEARHPGNGLPVIPPERSHSVNASKQIFQGDSSHVELPPIIHSPYGSLSLEGIDMDFIPLDSTLQQLFSKFGKRRERIHQLRSRMSLRNLWHGMKQSEQHWASGPSIFPPTIPVTLAVSQPQADNTKVYDDHRRNHFRGSSSSIGQGWRWLTAMPAREVQRRNTRGSISSGGERRRDSLRSHSGL